MCICYPFEVKKPQKKRISFFLLDPSWRTTTLTWKLLWAMVIWASLLTFRHQRLETLDFSQATRTAQWFFRWECRNIEKTKCRVKYHLRLIITLMFGLTISLAISWVVSIALLTGVCRCWIFVLIGFLWRLKTVNIAVSHNIRELIPWIPGHSLISQLVFQ